MTADFDFLSNTHAGFLYYETPALNGILHSTQRDTITSYDSTVHVKSPVRSGGAQETYACTTTNDCQVSYGMKYTPTVNRIYPSTVYSGQDVCFNVFTDQVSTEGAVLKNAKIGGYSTEMETYVEQNAEEVSTSGDYELCVIAGGNIAGDYDLKLTSDLGKYLVTDFAKSYDGTTEYTIRSVPKIDAVSHHDINTQSGTIITITGEGFQPDLTGNTVTVGGNACEVLEATSTDITCQITVSTSDFTGTTEFVGGIGAHSTEYDTIYNSQVSSTTVSPTSKHLTDMTSRSNINDDEDSTDFTRTVEAWFIPPQSGDYIFHATCDDNCWVHLSATPNDVSAATEIISTGWSQWRNFWDPRSETISSTAQTLTAGEQYYIKVIHDDYGYNDYFAVGFTIEDTSAAQANSFKGYNKLTIDPQHVFEEFTLEIPNTADVSYRMRFTNSYDNACTGLNDATQIFTYCNNDLCPCVSDTITADTSALHFRYAVDQYFNSIHWNYGGSLDVTKEDVTDGNGAVVGAKFTVVGRYALTLPSVDEFFVYSRTDNGDGTFAYATLANGTDYTFTQVDESTRTGPLTGYFRVKITNDDGDRFTEHIGLWYSEGQIARHIIEAAPELKGHFEIQTSYENMLSWEEGREIYYSLAAGYESYTFVLESHPDYPTELSSDTSHTILFEADTSTTPASNKPFYEVIPASFLRTIESNPQVIVESNGLTAACPVSGNCDITFTATSGEITSVAMAATVRRRLASYISDNTYSVTVTGTGLSGSTVNYVSVGSCYCPLDPSTPPTDTSITCLLSNCPAGSHNVFVQTTNGAITVTGSVVLEYDVAIDSATPTTLYDTGGQTITLLGEGFPPSATAASRISDFAVTFSDGSECTVTEVSDSEIKCTTPAGLSGSLSITVTVNGKTSTLNPPFTVSAVTDQVISIDKAAVSPVEKQNLVITANAASSSDVNDYVAIIETATKTIKMKVNDISANGSNWDFTVRYPGTPSGDVWTVYIEHNGQRYASTVTISTEVSMTDITVTGNSNREVSTAGGNIVEITGTGFTNNDGDVIVVFGNSRATVISSTDTLITARAPAATSASAAEVTVFLRPNIEVPCGIAGGCTATYIDDTQTVDSASTTLDHVGGVITITGSGFGANANAVVDGYDQTTVSSTATQVEIKLNKINDPESVSVEVNTDDANIPNVFVTLPFAQGLYSVSPTTGSTGGQLVTLNVAGLGLLTTSNLKVVDSSGNEVCTDAQLVDSSTVTCTTLYSTDFTSGIELRVQFDQTSTTSGQVTTVTLTCDSASDCTFTSDSGSTPTISSVTNTTNDVTVDISGFSFDNTYTVTFHYGSLSVVASSISGTTATATFANGIPPGTFDLRVSFELNGDVTYSDAFSASLSNFAPTTTDTTVNCSWNGGCLITIAQDGLKAAFESGDASLTVCGNEITEIDSSSDASTVYARAPAFVNSHSQSTYNLVPASVINGTVVGTADAYSVFDGASNTRSSATGAVEAGVDFGSGFVGEITQVKYFMGKMVDKPTNCVGAVTFQTSDDGSTWTDVFSADRYLKRGWNNYTASISARAYRFSVSNYAACPLSEVELYGIVIGDSASTSESCTVSITSGSSTDSLSGVSVEYNDAATASVSDISPRYGTYKGGESIQITGTNFPTDATKISMEIDGIACVIESGTVSATGFNCTTGARPSVVSNPTTVITLSDSTVNGHAAMNGNTFTYANYWSDLDTWGGEFAPQDGESVLIPAGQMLIVDIDSSPLLNAIIVQGSLVFAPDADPTHHRTFDAEYIFVDRDAVLEIGTETNRYTSRLTITMHGSREDPQIPTYGNKGIFVRFGQLDIHGVERNVTWTELETTLAADTNIITLTEYVDWQEGEQIVIASTDFNLDHAETFYITEVDNSGSSTVLTLDHDADHKHYAGVTTYTGTNDVAGSISKDLEMRAEVGLLSRNVVYKGADDDSVTQQYGAHIMLHSPGDESLTGRISYAEFTQVGQAFQLGRYPIHFHMIGNVHNSYIIGNAIHHTYNRACTIHGVHYLTLKNNVAYETMGHTFFIEDAAETNNHLERNLAVKSKRSWSLLNTDQTPASFWITHPTNTFIDNHAAGSDRYGFWFDLQTHPIGPSEDSSICPEYEALGEFTGNVAHSNGRYGLRFFHRFVPVENPCAGLANFRDREQPIGDGTTPVTTIIRDFLGYKNNRTALIGTEIGDLKFHNIRAADNLLSGVEFSITAAGPWLDSSDEYHLQDALIVGASDNWEPDVQNTHEAFETTRGLKGAKTEKMRVKDTIFANFDANAEWAAIGTCSHCEGPATDSSGRTYFFKNLTFVDTVRRVRFDIPFKEIIYDEDGTLANSTHRWVVFDFPHLRVPECELSEAAHNGLICDDSIKIRRIVLDHPKPDNALKNLPLKIINLRDMDGSVYPDGLTSDPSNDQCKSLSTTSLSDMQATDDAAIDIQNQLLQAFDDRATNFTAYEEAVAELERTGDTSYQTLATNFNTAVEEAQSRIDTLEPQLEQYEGAFDKLWETDVNVCNTTSHSFIEFRAKANPKKNWVFNVITGYEYKIHVDQGATINSVTGSYSYPELLNGETDGVIVHLNTTERNEAWNFTYTDSSGNRQVSTPQQTWLSLDSATNAIGDVYFNNLTRHIQVKFDGQDSDKLAFEFVRDECISWGNCNPDMTEDAEIETTARYWSDPTSWTSGTVPVEGDEVLIEPTWNMIYDLEDSPVFKSIEVNGRLTIQNDGTDRILRTYLIFIRKGELNIGSEEEPFTANMNIILYGERADRDIYFHSNMFEGGNKVIANTGNLTMVGTEVDVKWTRLAAPVAVNGTSITLVDTPTTWKQGDELGIAPSGRDYTHRDKVTIDSISGNVVTLTTGVNFEHYGAASHDSSVSGDIDIRAEVVHLSRNIKISGTNEDRWGGHVVTAHNEDTQFLAGQLTTVTRRGWAKIDSVEFVNCSQYDTDKASVRFADISGLGADDVRSYVKNSAVHDGLGIGIMVTSAEDITVDSNVVWFHHIGGIWMKASDNSVFNNNVVAGMGTRYWSQETRLDELAAFNFCNKDQNCQNLTVTNNVAAGGHRVGFAIPTVCDDTMATYSNNLAHTFQHGAWVFNNIRCSGTEYFGNFQAYKTLEQGVLAYQGYSSIHVKNIETLDCGRGATIMIGKNQDVNQISVSDSTFWGESAELPQDSGSFCIDIYGWWLAAASEQGKLFPEVKLSKLPYEKIKSYNNWFTEATVTNVTFKNWASATRQNCASASTKEQKVLFINPFNSDHGPVNKFVDPTFDNVAHDAMARLSDPNPAWAIIKDCGNFPCTAPNNVVFKFEGATFTGSNTPTITGDTFQIIPNEPGAADNIADCSAESTWNGNLCYNTKIAQLMFESLDGDKEDRMLSPIQIMSIDTSTGEYGDFNNTLNTFMDHCWDGHYTCQKRLSRFPSIAVMDSKHEIYYSGTPPGKSRYTLEGAEDGEYMVVKIDYSKSIIFKVFSVDSSGTKTEVDSNRYNRTLGKPAPLDVSVCGANRYEQANFIYEFVLRYGCDVHLEAQEHLIGLARLQMSMDDFFEDDFVGKLSFALGITTDQIRIVSVTAGSTIIAYQITSTESGESTQRRNLVEMAGMLASQHAAGTLDLGAPILDLVNEVISSTGSTVTAGTGDYSKKEVHASVYVLIALSAIAVLAGIVYGVIKVVKMSKVYKEISNDESVEPEKDFEKEIDNKDKNGQIENA